MHWLKNPFTYFVVIVVIVILIRLRPGGPGPAANYIPAALRPKLNAFYRRFGWQEPFDAEGNRNPRRKKL